MKKTKTMMITLTATLLAGSVFAQQNASHALSQGISNNYPAPVIKELKQVLEKIPLNTQKQEAMANYLLKKENRLKEIANQSPEQQIVLKDSLQRVFVSMLSNEDLKNYYTAVVNAKNKNKKEAEKPQLKPIDQDTLNAIVLERDIQIAMLKDAENDVEKFKKLKSGIASSYKKDIDKFLLDKGYKKNAYEEFAEGVLQTYVTKYQLNNKEKDALRPLIVKKYRELSTVKSKNIPQTAKDSAVNTIEEQASKDLDKFIAFNHKAPKSSKLLQIISRKAYLQLTEPQIESFIDFLALTRKNGAVKENNKEGVVGPDVFIAKTLNKDQYLKYLALENKDKASEKAKIDWQDAQKLGLTNGLDSASTLKVLTNYYTSRMIAQQRKDLKPEEQEGEAIQLKGAVPLLITKLKTARKKPNTEMALKKGFTW